MAVEGRLEARTMQAGADMRTLENRIMRATGANTVNVASNAGGGVDDVIGVLINTPNSGQNASVAFDGLAKVAAGAATTANALLTTNASGRAINAVSGDWTVGQGLEAAGADGEVIACLLRIPAIQLPSSVNP